jgi:hypothetical protein
MSFSFGFFGGDPESNASVPVTDLTVSAAPPAPVPLKRHFPLEMFDAGGDIIYTPVAYGGVNFGKVDIQETEESVDKTSDIIPGIYEGGNKVWECSTDLTAFLFENKTSLPSPASSKVLELGCGHGFPGISALKLGYQQVVFSDLNGDVIDSATWPNIYLNCRDAVERAICYSGDWEVLSTELLTRSVKYTVRYNL